MIYQVCKGWDTGGNVIYEWKCNCVECTTTTSPCLDVQIANFEEMKERDIFNLKKISILVKDLFMSTEDGNYEDSI